MGATADRKTEQGDFEEIPLNDAQPSADHSQNQAVFNPGKMWGGLIAQSLTQSEMLKILSDFRQRELKKAVGKAVGLIAFWVAVIVLVQFTCVCWENAFEFSENTEIYDQRYQQRRGQNKTLEHSGCILYFWAGWRYAWLTIGFFSVVGKVLVVVAGREIVKHVFRLGKSWKLGSMSDEDVKEDNWVRLQHSMSELSDPMLEQACEAFL